MMSVLIIVLITGLAVIGDFFIKLATGHADGMKSVMFMFGAGLYGVTAIGWFILMRSHSLAAISVFYSAASILLLGALGFFVFKEAFGLREVVGVSLAIASVVVMAYEA
jgi:drug/metabolite transporter (DMT)-like permease